MPTRSSLVPFLALLVLAAIAPSGVTSAEVLSPAPTTVYREFPIHISSSGDQWRVTDPNASFVGTPGNSPSTFLPNPRINFSLPAGTLTGALSAEVIADYWGGHVGTTGQRLRFNNKPFITLPELANTPTDAECYTQQWNPGVAVPLSHLLNGANVLEGTSGGQTCFNFNWGQWGWYGVVLRIYYDPATQPARPTGSITAPAPNATIGENPTIQVNASGGGGIRSVEVLARYDGPDWDGDGVFLEYHQAYHRSRTATQLATAGHVGTDTTSPYSIVWSTQLVPDQTGIRLLARVEGTNGLWYVTPEVSGIRLQRSNASVLHFKPQNVPRRFWVRGASAQRNLTSNITIPAGVNLNQVTSAKLIVRTWNGIDGQAEAGQTHGTWVNNHKITVNYGENHHYSIDVLDIPVSWLTNGLNTIKFDSTSSHHGIEILWPGPELVLRTGGVVNPPVCGNGITETGEECDDGNTVNGDGCQANCTLPPAGTCGNGVIEGGEQCDDGNTVNGDGCQANCTLPVVGADLPAMYPFEETGTTVIDIANDNDGLLVAAAQRVTGGRFGKGIAFNGSTGQVDLGALNVLGQMTIAMWIKADDFGITDARLISKASSELEDDHYFMLSTVSSSGNRVRFRLKTSNGGTATLIATNATLTAGTWIHVAATYNGSQMRLYQDGDLVGTLAKSGSIVGHSVIEAWIGNQPGGGKSFDGVIDEVLIDDRAYTEAEIEAVMSAPLGTSPGNCGNGTVNAGEECDDGNTTDGDGCQADCRLPDCGDGVVDAGEQCDDGNTNDGDACRNDCLLPDCGDGIVDAGEQCDDGNTNDGDACANDCTSNGPPGSGNLVRNGDFASGPAFWSFYGAEPATFSADGGEAAITVITASSNVQLFQFDLAVEGGKQYELRFRARANRVRTIQVQLLKHTTPYSGYGLKQTFALDQTLREFQHTFTVPGGDKTDARLMFQLGIDVANGDQVWIDDVSLAPPAACGNGLVDVGEQCDDGNTVGGDGCQADCRLPVCGDGVTDAGEQCDDGNTVGGDGCQADCRLPVCGDGVTDAGEQCDDGNTVGGDGCQADCRLPVCGDGVTDAGEQCDDGNAVDDDDCANDCSSNVTVGPNLVQNGDFSAGTAPWFFYTDGVGSFAVQDGEARVTIGSSASNIQLHQRDLPISGSAQYRLRFTVSNTGGGDLSVRLLQHGTPYTNYGLDTFINVTSTPQTVELLFTTTPGDKTDGRLMFWIGSSEVPGTVYVIDDVELVEVGP